MNKIVIYARPCVNVVNKDFFHDDELSCIFRLFSYTVSTKYPKMDGNDEKPSRFFWNLASSPSNQQQKRWRCFANNGA